MSSKSCFRTLKERIKYNNSNDLYSFTEDMDVIRICRNKRRNKKRTNENTKKLRAIIEGKRLHNFPNFRAQYNKLKQCARYELITFNAIKRKEEEDKHNANN